MKTHISIFILIAVAFQVSAQDKYANTYVCTKGKIHFFSGSLMEDIEGNSNSAVCVLNTQTKKVNAIIKHSTFTLKNGLMQEHFNEDYMESDKYPQAVLDMVIAEDITFTKDGIYDVTLKGTLEMHGVKQERYVNGKLIIKQGQPIEATASFIVKMADHKIKIPSIVGANIADEIKVDVDFVFEKYKP